MVIAAAGAAKVTAKLRFVLHKDKMEKAEEKKFRRVFYQTGAYAMRVNRNLIRSPKGKGRKARTKSSKAGKPPIQQKKVYRKSIRFEVDRDKFQYVVIGARQLGAGKRDGRPIPELLERGGNVSPSKSQKKFAKIFKRSRPKRAKYRARPHAYNKESIIHTKWREFTKRIPLQ